MMDYTDRDLRYLLRLLSRRAVLYTEMVTAPSLVHNEDVSRWLGRTRPFEDPVVLQLGGSDPGELATATGKAAAFGYDEINLNCGCPSDRVAGKGSFGAALMRDPQVHVVKGCVCGCVFLAAVAIHGHGHGHRVDREHSP